MAHTLTGVVSSDKRDKTITVLITSRETHPIYKKQFTVTRKYAAHDEKNEANEGDQVEIIETRPISRSKTYRLVKILERSHGKVELKEDVVEVVAKRKDEEGKK
ncbi:MAG: 30S ribosomal protein S17 [Candidatus Nomurabacteria bacterium]|jgi:small subunit ribosomal protein S17|nr:30S ribosomal protein S17 [Candidatus Nomurabacteria bacterium]